MYIVPGFLSLARPLLHVSLPLLSPAILSVPFPQLFPLIFCRKYAVTEIAARTENMCLPCIKTCLPLASLTCENVPLLFRQGFKGHE